MNRKPILILGIGNILLRDEGVGVHVVQKMRDMDLPPGIDLMDGGTMGLDLLFYIEDREKVIVIDTVSAGDPPGTIYRFTDESLVQNKPFLRTAHGIDFTDVIKTAELLKTKPKEIIFVGIEPADMSEGIGLSDIIAQRVPTLIKMVLKEIDSEEPVNP
jgi:hydrogenase maturation protease